MIDATQSSSPFIPDQSFVLVLILFVNTLYEKASAREMRPAADKTQLTDAAHKRRASSAAPPCTPWATSPSSGRTSHPRSCRSSRDTPNGCPTRPARSYPPSAGSDPNSIPWAWAASNHPRLGSRSPRIRPCPRRPAARCSCGRASASSWGRGIRFLRLPLSVPISSASCPAIFVRNHP